MVRLQIMSDLHLEQDESYERFFIYPRAPYLALLGDIGNLVYHSQQYRTFIERHLGRFDAIFYVHGLKEGNKSTYELAQREMESLNNYCKMLKAYSKRGEKWGDFVFLNNSRYDIPGERITVLGGTLFTFPPRHLRHGTDRLYRNELVIVGWNIQRHIAAHLETMSYLSREVATIAKQDPKRSIIILTHHCPTIDPRIIGPRHDVDPEGLKYQHASDLTGEHPWTGAKSVKLWAFGSTHYNCRQIDWETGMQLYSNQRGYPEECPDFDMERYVEIIAPKIDDPAPDPTPTPSLSTASTLSTFY
ncbi:hypothetical protein F5Y11DRAFT_282192 [Daldinia sp. FL1419]|nr:hypothetical protein F5Y11DRAFT_282192 [Daldinia sp. FL1419]